MSTQAAVGPASARRNGAGTTALVTGTVALVLAALIIFFPVAAILGVIAAIFGLVGIGRANRGEANNKNHAIAVLLTGLLAVAIAVSMGVRLGTFIMDHEGASGRSGDASRRHRPRANRTTAAHALEGAWTASQPENPCL